MTSINSASSSSTGVSDVSDKSQWNDDDHWKITDFFHKHMPKVTNDIANVGKDVVGGFEHLKSLVGDGYEGIKDFEGAVKHQGFKATVKEMVSNEESGKSLFNHIVSDKHRDDIKADALALKDNIKALAKDAKPLEADAVIAFENGVKMVKPVMDIVAQAAAVYGGQPPNVASVIADLRSIKNDLEAGLQMNSTKTQSSGNKSGYDNNNKTNSFMPSNASASNLYALDSMRTSETNTDNETREKRHHQHHNHHRRHAHKMRLRA